MQRPKDVSVTPMPIGGRDFLRLMTDQSRRAADFDRRMRWSVMRKELSESYSADVPTPDVIDLRPIEEQAERPRED